MSRSAWFSLGVTAGMWLVIGGRRAIARFDAVAAQYVRSAGSDTVRRIR